MCRENVRHQKHHVHWTIPNHREANGDLTEDQLKTTFVVPGWAPHYFERLPFGLTGAPATFQALMDKILPIGKGGRLGKDGICFAYLDDIIVPSQDIPQGLDRLERILQILIQHNLKLHPKKCQLIKIKPMEWLAKAIWKALSMAGPLNGRSSIVSDHLKDMSII